MHPFLLATTATPVGAGRFSTTIDTSWYQGKGAYGGVVAGLFCRCVEAVVRADDPQRFLRSLTIHFAAPARAGDIDITVSVVRRGALITHLSIAAEQKGHKVAFGSATCAAARVVDERLAFDPPPRTGDPAPDTVAPVPLDLPLMPTFCQHFEYRFCVGDPPYAQAARVPAVMGGYIRTRAPLALDAALAAAFLDAFPPAVLSRLAEPRAAASVDFTVHFFHDLTGTSAARDPAAHHLVVVSSRIGDGGFLEELCELFDERGALLAQCRQLVAVL